MSTTKNIYNLQIDTNFYNFIENEVLPDIDIKSDTFWSNFSELITDLSPENKRLLAVREDMQLKID